VDHDLIAELYGRTYRESVAGRRRLRLFNVSRLADLSHGGDGPTATIESLATGERTVVDADVVVYATGYRPADPARVRSLGARPSTGRDR
jgi:L-ornithine N5-oxygenase